MKITRYRCNHCGQLPNVPTVVAAYTLGMWVGIVILLMVTR